MKKSLLGTLMIASALWSCQSPTSQSTEKSSNSTSEASSAVNLYSGGDIITMEGEQPVYAEALVTEQGKIVFVGTLADAKSKYGKATPVDLQGKTLIPGFIDGHAHFHGFGSQAVAANLLANPDGNVNNIPDLIQALKDWQAKNGTEKTQGWIVGMGFDDAALKEKRFPTKEDLDQVSKDIPICIIHISGHFAVLNSKGLELKKVTAASKNPDGGVIRRMAGSQEPNGVLEELAAIPIFFPIVYPSDKTLADYYIEKGQDLAMSFGYTTANEGRAMANHEQLASFAEEGKMKIDVMSWVDYSFPQYMRSKWYSKQYQNHYRVAGIKFTMDGSPQGRTAWRTTPYLIPPDGQKKGYKGYPAIPDDQELTRLIDTAFANNWQIKAHCNGDAAADQFFRALAPAVAKYGNKDRRNTLIHGQLIRMDQLDSMKKYDLVASLFPMHTFYWGDWYKKIIGPEKAQQISPINSALKKGLRVTSHTDAPVALPNLMMIMWTTVNRLSRSGTVMGEAERLTPYQALKSVTIWGAEQFFEEDRKGTLTVGKLADMVVLDKNPLKVDPLTLKDIKVMETIKEGNTVFKR